MATLYGMLGLPQVVLEEHSDIPNMNSFQFPIYGPDEHLNDLANDRAYHKGEFLFKFHESLSRFIPREERSSFQHYEIRNHYLVKHVLEYDLDSQPVFTYVITENIAILEINHRFLETTAELFLTELPNTTTSYRFDESYFIEIEDINNEADFAHLLRVYGLHDTEALAQ